MKSKSLVIHRENNSTFKTLLFRDFLCFPLILVAAAVVAEDGVVDPLAVLGYGRVDSRELGVSAAIPPGHQTVDPPLAHQRTARVPLKQNQTRERREFLNIPISLGDKSQIR